MTDADTTADGVEQEVELHPVPGEPTVWVTGHVEHGFGHFAHIDGHRIAEGYATPLTGMEHGGDDA